MKKTIIISIFCLTAYVSFAQNQTKIDSLLEVLKTEIGPNVDQTDIESIYSIDSIFTHNIKEEILQKKAKTTKVFTDIELALSYKKRGEYTLAIMLFTKILKTKDSLGIKEDIAFCYNNIGQMYARLGNYTKALDYNSKALKLSKELDDKDGLFSEYNTLGMIKTYQDNYTTALDYFIKASKINDLYICSKKNTITSLSNIGYIYETFGNYPLALQYYFESLLISREIKDESSISEDYLNIGNAYFEQGDNTKALSYSFKSLKISEELFIKGVMISNFCLIGEIYLSQKKYREALHYLKKGEHLSLEIGEQSSFTTILNTIGAIHIELKNYKQAQEYLIKSIRIGEKIGAIGTISSASYSLAKAEKALGNHKTALKSFELYHATYDSLLGAEKSKQLSRLQVQYETEKKEQEIKNLAQQASIQSLELKQANFNKTIFGIVSIVLLLVGLVLYLVNRQKQLVLKQKAQDIEQNLLRVQMNPHFIFNAMTSIQDYMNQGDAKQAGIYLVKFSKLIRQVLDNSRTEFISLDQEINMLDNYLSIQNLKRDHPFNFEIEVDENIITEEIAIPPMFAQPFIENAIEHGIAHIKEGATITLYFSIEKNHLKLKITDNGSGIEEVVKTKRIDHRSHAIKITEERIELYKRMKKKKIDFEIQNLTPGTQVTFNLPFQYV